MRRPRRDAAAGASPQERREPGTKKYPFGSKGAIGKRAHFTNCTTLKSLGFQSPLQCVPATIPLVEGVCGEGLRAVRQLAIKDDGIPTRVAVNAALAGRSVPRQDLLNSNLRSQQTRCNKHTHTHTSWHEV